MDYRAHHEHVMNVIGNEIDEEMNEREADKGSVCMLCNYLFIQGLN